MAQIRYVNVNGSTIALPSGFRFMPTDLELVLIYLSKKMLSLPLPLPDNVYPQVDFRLYAPWELPGQDDNDDEKYFFTTVGPTVPTRGRNLARPTMAGVWRMRGPEEVIMSVPDRPVAVKRVYNFQRNANQAVQPRPRTTWTMHEYRLLQNHDVLAHLHHLARTHGVEMEWREMYLCKIVRRRRGVRWHDDDSASCIINLEEEEDSS